MKALIGTCVLAVVAQGLGSCPGSGTTVRLVNDANYRVDVQLFYDDDQELPKELIELDGEEVNMTVLAGQTRSFTRSCEDLQAIFIKDADLRAPGDDPEEETDAYREPDDFGCGDTITFTFTQNITATDLDIHFSSSAP